MAQNVESTVNVKVVADTSNAKKETEYIRQRLHELAEEARRNKAEFHDFSESIDRLSKGFSALGKSTNQAYEQQKKVNAEDEKTKKFWEEIEKELDEALGLQKELNNEAGKYADNTENIKDNINSNVNDTLSGDAPDADSSKLEQDKQGIQDVITLLSTLASKAGISSSSLSGLASAFGKAAGSAGPYIAILSVCITAMKAVIKQSKEMTDTFDKVAKSLGRGAVESVEWFGDSLTSFIGIVEDGINKLDELSESGIELERAFLATSAYIGQDATDQIYNFMGSITSASNTMMTSINSIVTAAGSMGLTSDKLVEVTENMTLMGRNLSVLTGDVDKAFSDLGQTISKGYVGRNSILYNIFTKEEIEQVRQLGSEVERYNFIMQRSNRVQELYNAYLGTAAGKVALLKLQYKELMSNIGTVALNLYAIVAPVLTKILELANGVLSAFIRVFNWQPKSVGLNSIASDIGSVSDKTSGSLDKLSKSAKEAKRQVASFDDVIQINDNSSSGIADIGDIGELEDFSGLLGDLIDNSEDLKDIWAKFKELLEDGDWFGAGTEFMHVIGDLLRGIDWDNIQNKAREIASNISKFINGLFDENAVNDWKAIGSTIAQTLNTVFLFIKELLYDIDFKDIGKSLGAAWSEFWDTLDGQAIADSLYLAITDAFDLLAGWLEGGGLSKAATKLADIIKKFFGNFFDRSFGEDNLNGTLDNMTSVAEGIINDILNALYIIVEALTSDDVKRVVFGLITRLVTAFKENAPEWGDKLHTIIDDVLDFITEGIDTANDAGLKGAIFTFLDKLQLDNLLSEYIGIKIKLWWLKFTTEASVALNGVGKWFRDFFVLLGALAFELLTLGTSHLFILIKENWDAIKELFNNRIEDIRLFFENIDQTASEWINNIANTIGNTIENIKTTISEKVDNIKYVLGDLWDFISDLFNPSKWLELGANAISGLWDGIKEVWNSMSLPSLGGLVGGGFNFNIPKLFANGGVVTRATNAIIGEAGAEAVMPLENNTQWMDKLATKLAGQINSGAGQNGGTINLQLSDKPFYTRAEMYEFGSIVAESLRTYGINIAVV